MSENRSENILPFDYLVSSGALAISGTALVNLTLAQDSWFELHVIAGSSTLDAATDFMPNNYSCQITDQSTGRQFANARIPERVLSSPANGGMRLLRPVQFAPSATIQFDFLNLSAASTNTVSLVLKGFKIYQL